MGCTRYSSVSTPQDSEDLRRKNFGSLFGEDALWIRPAPTTSQRTITGLCPVNKFLWNGAMETIAFMPIIQAVPQSGRILTDWYVEPEHPNVRVRLTVYIHGTELRADAVHVLAERQRRSSPYKKWMEYRFSPEEITQLEILIVERARKIRAQLLSAN